jgi:hypothetical protein
MAAAGGRCPVGGYRRSSVSTRRLIALALACAIAILLAGGVFLVRLAGSDADDDAQRLLQVGQAVTVAGVDAALVDADRIGDRIELVVEVTATDESVDDVERLWAVLRLRDIEPLPRAGGSCAGAALAAGATLRCTLVFTVADGDEPLVAVLGLGTERASWAL